MPRLSLTEVSHRAAILGPLKGTDNRGYMAMARAIWLLLGEYDLSYGEEHPLGIALRTIEKELT